MTTEHLLQVCSQSPEPPPLDQVQNWSVRTLSLSDPQHDNRAPAAGVLTSPEPPPLYQVQNWSVRTLPISDWQHDNTTSAAGMPTTVIDNLGRQFQSVETVGDCWRREAGTAQWLERRTRDQKVAGSSPGRSGGKIFFSMINLLC